MKIGIIGGGSWGTALAKVAAEAGHQVILWAYEKEVVQQINQEHCNSIFLPGFNLPSITATAEIGEAIQGQELLISVVPSHAVRDVWSSASKFLPKSVQEKQPLLVSATKGIENGTLLTMMDVLKSVLPSYIHDSLAVLSGPSFSREVAARQPTVVVVASAKSSIAEQVQHALSTDRLRIYTSNDVIGVEIGGAVKNVVAIATGISDGLHFGCNTRAALITRGLAEITRLAVALAAHPMTLAGLAGMGDLVLTCTSELSRNHTVGLRLGQGESLTDILQGMNMVAEGVKNTISCLELARRLGVEMPITATVYSVLYEGLDPFQAVGQLMKRQLKPELENYSSPSSS